MSQKRRDFIRSLGGFAGATFAGTWLNPLKAQSSLDRLEDFKHASPELAASDEDFWFEIRQAYTSSNSLINLNSGGVSPHPKLVQEKVYTYSQFANEAPAYYMWRTMGRLRTHVRRQLAELGGCDVGEVAIMRNATEALETVINGLNLKKGDEILTTDQDYPSMLNTLDMLERRRGVKIAKISLPTPAEDASEIVQLFKQAINKKTKAILFCHMINLSGQILPAQQICSMARDHGVQTIVDGAHSFCQLAFKISDLGCDYFGTSLHKWLCAPFGTGMLYVKKDRIADLWPMYGYPEGEKDKITKFEHLGTRPFPIELAISDAIAFHNGIGTARKSARLRYLKEYWVNQVKDVAGFSLNTSMKPESSCGIANFSLANWGAGDLSRELLLTYGIYVTATNHKDVSGIRISPNVFTSLKDLDHLASSIKLLAQESRP
ncbi:MAG: aminotransferase class V-fold PLP-dependent enzyme [Bacteroidota bacterium]